MPLKLTLTVLRKHPAGWLLAGQLLTILLYPFMEGAESARAASVVFGNLVLALALWVVFRSPVVNWIGWVLALPAVGISLAAHLGGFPKILFVAHILEAALYFYAAVGLIVYMLADNEVTMDELFAAGATFTLLAWGFAFMYSVCQTFVPGSFSAALHPDIDRNWLELLFLSFSTLSGVGLSDITPAAPMARSLVMIEMFSGVMYLAVVVSRLIAMAGHRLNQNR
jgi:hypothetical protein